MMKKIITGLLVLFLLSISVACAKETAPTPPSTPSPTPAPAPAPAPGPISPPGVPPGPVTPPAAHFEVGVDFVPSKTIYKPGEKIEIELRLTNKSVEPVIISTFPPSISIALSAIGEEPGKIVHTFPTGVGERELVVVETVTHKYSWDQNDDEGKQVAPGWYQCTFEINIKKITPPTNEWSTGGGKRIFLIQYPQGAMEKIIDLDLSQTAIGLPLEVDNEIIPVDIVLTLKRAELTQEGASFFVLLTSPNNPLPSYDEVWWHIALDEHAQYVFDGTVKDARGANTRYTDEGIELRWGREGSYRDPIPSDTKELTFIITRLGDDWEGPWEFRIPLE